MVARGEVGVAGFLAAAGLIGGAASAAGHGLADSHKRAGDVGGADVIFQTATADNVFCLEHHCGFHFRCVAEFSIIPATGRADIYTETPVRVSGFKRVIDEQDWTITKVTHFLNNSGFTTSLELEVRLSDVEYETEDDE